MPTQFFNPSGATNPQAYYYAANKYDFQKAANDAGVPESGFTTGVPQNSVLNQMAFPSSLGIAALAVNPAEELAEWDTAHSGVEPWEQEVQV